MSVSPPRFAGFCLVALSFAGLLVPLLNAQTKNEPPVATKIDFAKDIAPILRDQCVECHDESLQMADLRLDSRRAMLDAGVIETGNAEDSLLIQRLHDRDLGILMPPSGRLNKTDVTALQNWIDAGAPWPDSIEVSKKTTKKAKSRHKIFEVIRNGSVASLEELLKHDVSNVVDRFGATPLMRAAMYGSADHVRVLLEQEADPNGEDHDGLTPLMYAAGGDVEKTNLLLKYGAKVDTQSKLGRTALLVASAFANNTPTVKALLRAGADVKYADRRGWTAVVLAARTGDVELVRMLLDAGGIVNGGNAKRLSPGTPLMQAAWASDIESAKLLLSRGAADDQRSLNASLITASTHGCLPLVELLLDAGADPHANIVTNYVPESPILAACGSDTLNIDIVRKLVATHVDLAKKDNRGETPLSLARQRGNSPIAKLLTSEVSAKTADSRSDTFAERKVTVDAPATETAIRKLTQKSVSLLQSCGPKFFAHSGCTACHQQTLTSLAVPMARARGLSVDERTERQQIKLTAFDLGRKRTAFLQRMKSGGTAHRIGYLLWGLSAADYPADETTDTMYVELAGLQLHNGSWVSDAHRPPTEYSPFSATAVSMRAIQHYSPPGLKAATARRIAKATEWLANTQARANAEKAFRLLGLHWGGADPKIIAQAKADLLRQQTDDGGWSQLPDLPPDAYATGLTLFALAETAQLRSDDPAYSKGVEFLMNTAEDDGSWQVKTRSFAFQPYFESGFPHEKDQWISAAATGWATMALLHTIEPAKDIGAKPFAKYPVFARRYLKRIHGTPEDKFTRGALAYRDDYPGGFTKWQNDARKKLVKLLGLARIKLDVKQHQPLVQLGEPIQEDGYQRQLGEIETEPGTKIPFWLLTPSERSSARPRPLVICSHGHSETGWNTYAGVYQNDEDRRESLAKDGNIGVQSVRQGYVTLVPATRGLANSTSPPDIKGRHGKRICRAQLMHCLVAGRTPVGERVWDIQRLLDWALDNLKGIDPDKTVLLGNSGGGVLTVYAAALDERIRVAIPSCSFTSYTSSTGYIFHCDCCVVPRSTIELADMPDIGALAAPRWLLAVHGKTDGLHSAPDVDAAMNRVRRIYSASGNENRFRHHWGDAGHKFYPDIMWPFVREALEE